MSILLVDILDVLPALLASDVRYVVAVIGSMAGLEGCPTIKLA
jgi:hypothetical protein